MSDTTIPAAATAAAEEADNSAAPDFDAETGGAASFADAEMREILNLLGNDSGAGSCCGGSCCSA